MNDESIVYCATILRIAKSLLKEFLFFCKALPTCMYTCSVSNMLVGATPGMSVEI